MSPTVFREKGYRFFFFSREESRISRFAALQVGQISGHDFLFAVAATASSKRWLSPSSGKFGRQPKKILAR